MIVASFLVGLVIGGVTGALIYRNDAKKTERDFEITIDALREEVDKLRRIVSHERK